VVDSGGKGLAVEHTPHCAQPIPLFEVAHGGFVFAAIVMRLSEREMQQLAVPRHEPGLVKNSPHSRDQRVVVCSDLPVGRNADPGRVHVEGQFRGAFKLGRRLLQKPAIGQEIGEDRAGFPTLRMGRDSGPHLGEGAFEVARSFKRARRGDLGSHAICRGRGGRSAERSLRVGSEVAGEIKIAETHLGVDEIRL
jgi:hypothetical protein